MGGSKGKIAAIYRAMQGEAEALTFYTISRELGSTSSDIKKVLDFLDNTFEDPESKRRAHAEWASLRQGRTPFDKFYADFERLLLEADWEN